jgi:stress-induced-phosphoprotein 1
MAVKEAQREKELGNECYKAKKFDEAIAHYNKAIELDPKDVSFLTNRAAVFFEQGKLGECIADCDSAVEKGHEVHADFKMIARALQRKGTALQKQGDLEGAISAFSKSLTEHRTADTLKKLNDAERILKEKRQKEYEDPVKGEEERELGNKLFKEQKYPEALAHYSEAVKRNPGDHRAYSNRSACYTKLAAWAEGLKDAERCLELEPGFSKGYSRKGAVLFFMKDYDKAMAAYQQGLELDPENEELREGVQRCVSTINKVSRGEVGEDELRLRQERAMADPEVQMILTDPIMRQVLNDFQEDPKAAQHHMKNAGIMAKLQKLINAGIVRVG